MNPEQVYLTYADGQQWSDIGGHLKILREFGRGNCFEIGVRDGLSTAAILMGIHDHGGHLWSLDVNENCGRIYDGPCWTFLCGHSVQDAGRILEALPKTLDFLFIDSDHTYETTIQELKLYAPRLVKGGIVAMHDVDLDCGVRPALEAYAHEIGKIPLYRTGSYGLGVLRP